MLISAVELAGLQLPKLPNSRQGIEYHAKKNNWPFEEVAGRARGGKLKKYLVSALPSEVQAAIREKQAAMLLAKIPVLPAEVKKPLRQNKKMRQLGLIPCEEGLARLDDRQTETAHARCAIVAHVLPLHELAGIPSLLDRALQSGADGGFELKNMSRWLPQQLAAMKTAGMGATLDNFSSLLNANQLSFMTAGSPDEAGNNLVNLLAKINSQDIVNKADKITLDGKEGFDFTDKMNERQAAGMNSLDALVDIVAEITAKDEKSAALMKQINAAQGDEAKLALLENQKALVDGTAIGQLVSDRQALMALLALVNNRQELTRLQAGQANAAGAVDGSYGFLAEGSGFKKAQFSLAKSEAEYGAFEKFSDRIGGWMQSAAQWMRGHPEQAQTATQVGYGATAASAAAVSAKAVSGGGGGFWSNWGSKLLGSKAGFGLGLLLHSEELNKGEAEFVALQRQYAKKRASATQAPLDSPVLKDSILQLDQSAQTNQQASQQYMQAAAENQAATAQMTGAAAQMTAAAAQMQAAAGRPIPVTVTVQNGNIVAYVNQAVERNSRKN